MESIAELRELFLRINTQLSELAGVVKLHNEDHFVLLDHMSDYYYALANCKEALGELVNRQKNKPSDSVTAEIDSIISSVRNKISEENN